MFFERPQSGEKAVLVHLELSDEEEQEDIFEFQHLQNLMKKRLGKSTRKLGAVRSEVEKCLAEEHIEFEINGRVKSIYSLHKKMKKVD